MATQDDVKKDIWGILKTYIPESVILAVAIYIGIMAGGSAVYKTLTDNEKLTEEYIQSLTNNFVLAFIIATVIVILACIFLFIKKRKNIIKQEELPKGKIDAFIVEQDEPSRDSKFNSINKNVRKIYWVLGVSLTSIVEHEKTLEKMASDNINIRLCMMNPDIAVNNLCLSSIENNACALKRLLEEIKEDTVKMDNVQEKVKNIDNCDNLLTIYHVLINVIHFNEYYVTATDYKERIKNSYDSLKRIRNSIAEKHGQDIIDLRVADSFMPMSLTIADASEENGRMVVEFHLPFTQYKVLFEINRSDNKELFEVFVNFYNVVWTRTQSNE